MGDMKRIANPGRGGRRRILLVLLALVPMLALYTVAAGAVSKDLTARDLQAIATLKADPHCAKARSFDDQVRCVRFIQNALLTTARASVYKCARWGEIAEPMEYLERGYGCCFDRARFMEKALEHYGFETRYLSLHDRSTFGPLAMLAPRVPSHASIEVLTERGWMGADSNIPMLLLTKAGKPFVYSQIREIPRNAMVDRIPAVESAFYEKPLLITYGLHSRNGGHRGINLPAPEINYAEFFKYNSFGIR